MRAELAALKAVVYGPDPPVGAVERMAQLRAALDGSVAPSRAAPSPPRRSRRFGPPVGALVALLAVLACASFLLQRTRVAPPPVPARSAAAVPPQVAARAGTLRNEDAAVEQVVLNHPDELSAEDWFTFDPGALPRAWSSAEPVTDRAGLVGPRTVPVALRAGVTRVLVFVVCSDRDARFRVSLDVPGRPPARPAGTPGAGCRGFTGVVVAVPAGARGTALRIGIGAGEHYAVTVYAR